MSLKGPDTKKFSFKIPSVFAIILGMMLLVVMITWIPGVVSKNSIVEIGGQIPHRLGIIDVLHATIQGIVKRADIIAFVLSIGAYISFILKSKALEAGVGVLINRFKGKEVWIIPICIIFFGLSGTIYNMAEETIAYYPILIPVMMFAGFDTITTIMVVTFGAGMGVIGSTIAPFSIIIASGALGTSPMHGIIWRIIIFIICMIAAITITMIYAQKVKHNPEKSAIYHCLDEQKKVFGHLEEMPTFTRKRKIICALFGLTFILMVLIELPWQTFFNIPDSDWDGLIGRFLSKYFPFLVTSIFWNENGGLFIDLSTLFFAMTFILGFMSWKGQEEFISSVVSGASDLLGVAFIISTSAGLGILLDNNNSGLATTIAKGISSGIGKMPGPLFLVVCYLIFIFISFFIPSTSGFAIAILPLFQQAAAQSNLESGMITAYINAEGFMNLISPAGLPMACLMIAKVNYKDFWRGCWPIILAAFLIPLILLPIGAAALPHETIWF